jgi:hypothetical protein
MLMCSGLGEDDSYIEVLKQETVEQMAVCISQMAQVEVLLDG